MSASGSSLWHTLTDRSWRDRKSTSLIVCDGQPQATKATKTKGQVPSKRQGQRAQHVHQQKASNSPRRECDAIRQSWVRGGRCPDRPCGTAARHRACTHQSAIHQDRQARQEAMVRGAKLMTRQGSAWHRTCAACQTRCRPRCPSPRTRSRRRRRDPPREHCNETDADADRQPHMKVKRAPDGPKA